MLVLILTLLILWLLFPLLKRYVIPRVQQFLIRQALKGFARKAGFDVPPSGSRRGRGNTRRGSRNEGRGGRPSGDSRRGKEPLIPKEYAEDVEFTEIHSYSSEMEIRTPESKIKIEEQVSDAEVIEIKKE